MPINQLSLSRQFECRCMLTKSNRANTFAETADAQRQTPLLLRIAASGHFEISPESKQQRRSFFPFKRNFPHVSTQSHTHHKTAIMSFRAGLRFFNAFRQQAANTGKPIAQRRAYSSAADTNATIPGPPQSRLQQLWASPVGPKTVHFWAPIMKWGLVLAGAADFARPVESLSLSQNGALMATGLIWTRWCFVIKPRNLLYVHSTCLLNFWVVKMLTVSI